MLSRFKSQTGQSLMEVVVVIGVLIVVITALTFATISSLRNAQFSKNQAQATKLAQEGLERVRSIRDRDPSGVVLWSSSTACSSSVPPSCPQTPITCPAGDCYFYLNSSNMLTRGGYEDAETIEPDNFRRQFFIEDYENTDQKKITVVVSWTDFSGTHESRLTTILRRI